MNVNITLLTTTICAARPVDRPAGWPSETTESMEATWGDAPKAVMALALDG
jgi:hypothetical protein